MHKITPRDLRRYAQNDDRGLGRHRPETHETPLAICLHGAPRERRHRVQEATNEMTHMGARDTTLEMPRQSDAVLKRVRRRE